MQIEFIQQTLLLLLLLLLPLLLLLLLLLLFISFFVSSFKNGCNIGHKFWTIAVRNSLDSLKLI